MGPWVHGSMGPWVHGFMGPWVHGFMGSVELSSLRTHGPMDSWTHRYFFAAVPGLFSVDVTASLTPSSAFDIVWRNCWSLCAWAMSPPPAPPIMLCIAICEAPDITMFIAPIVGLNMPVMPPPMSAEAPSAPPIWLIIRRFIPKPMYIWPANIARCSADLKPNPPPLDVLTLFAAASGLSGALSSNSL